MHQLLPMLLFAFSTSFTPGPNNFMILNSGMNFGVRKSLRHYCGICFGLPAMTLIVALGFGTVFLKHPWVKEILKVLGSAYLLYLAWQIFTANTDPKVVETQKPWGFLQALLFQWINPKAWLMIIGAISVFSLSDAYSSNAIAISLVFLFTCFPSVGAWLVFGASLQKILKEEKHRRWFNTLMAVGLVASIALIFI